MSYHTNFSLDVNGDQAVIQEFRVDCDDAGFSFNENGDFTNDNGWRDCHKDLAEFSKKHPDIVFTLNGEGEEAGDIWVTYAKNGKSVTHKAKIVLAEYDEADLK